MRVQLVCQFGSPVRGLSPYADALLEHLQRIEGLSVDPVDFESAYPAIFHPAERGGVHGRGELHWAHPWTWSRVARRPADVMHIQHWAAPLSVYLWPLANMARKSGKRLVITVHNPSAHEKSGGFQIVEDKFLRRADVLLVHGENASRHLRQRLGANSPPVHVIAHGLKPEKEPAVAVADDYHRLGLSRERRYVLLFGNLRGYKGVDVLLSAWLKARPQLPDVELVIAGRLWNGRQSVVGRTMARLLGTAEDANRLQEALANPGSTKGVILREGFQTDEDIDALIRISAMAVFPYRRFSGQSGAACRAASMGRPVLVSRVGALPDLGMDPTWLLTPGDDTELALRLVEKLSDPATAKAAASRQLSRVRLYDWGSVARAHMKIYRELA